MIGSEEISSPTISPLPEDSGERFPDITRKSLRRMSLNVGKKLLRYVMSVPGSDWASLAKRGEEFVRKWLGIGRP